MYYKVLYSKAMEETYYSTKRVAKILEVKTITIRRWIQSGKLIAYKIGKELRIKKSDLDKFMKERRVKV
ncbi:conserved hypothetical protein [Candidatus Roizmanbacteria bacterium]|nr:conserved hypothetical protein [Candidatus Roizmanbacteria bacterium]